MLPDILRLDQNEKARQVFSVNLSQGILRRTDSHLWSYLLTSYQTS